MFCNLFVLLIAFMYIWLVFTDKQINKILSTDDTL